MGSTRDSPCRWRKLLQNIQLPNRGFGCRSVRLPAGEETLFYHTCKSRACPSCSDRATVLGGDYEENDLMHKGRKRRQMTTIYLLRCITLFLQRIERFLSLLVEVRGRSV